MDKDILAATSPVIVKLFCLHCGCTHERRIKCGRLSAACVPEILAEPKLAEAPALTIAIYALRISWLRRGLGDRRGADKPLSGRWLDPS
jgi:hypothetical protein